MKKTLLLVTENGFIVILFSIKIIYYVRIIIL